MQICSAVASAVANPAGASHPLVGMLALGTMPRPAAGIGMAQPSNFELQRECDRLAEHNATCALIASPFSDAAPASPPACTWVKLRVEGS